MRGEHGSENADHQVETLVGDPREVDRVALLEADIRQARFGRPLVAGGNQVGGNVDPKDVGTAPRDEAIARSTPGPSSGGSSCAVPPGGKDTTFMAAGLGLAAATIAQAIRRRRR